MKVIQIIYTNTFHLCKVFFNILIIFILSNNAYSYSGKDYEAEIRKIEVKKVNGEFCLFIADDRIPKEQWSFLGRYFNFLVDRGIPLKTIILENQNNIFFFDVKDEKHIKKIYKNKCISLIDRYVGYNYNYKNSDLKRAMQQGRFNVKIVTAWDSILRFQTTFCVKKDHILNRK